MSLLQRHRLERARASKQFRDGTFHNAAGEAAQPMAPPLRVIREMFLGGAARVPDGPLPIESPLATWATPVSREGLRMTWLGHSTLLLEIDGVRLLTDPVFGERASPFAFVGPKRFHPVPATIAQLPKLDAVLLSHDHYDHLCNDSMRRLAALRVPIITSLGVGARLEALGVAPSAITELDWWEEHTLPGGALKLTAAPAQHFSGRGLSDRNVTLWSSWVVTTARRRIYFSGDTGLAPELATIRERLGPFDVTMLEIGAWNEAWGAIHLGPVQAMAAFQRLGGGTLLPVHWGTFDLALHRWSEPAETLLGLAEAAKVRLITPRLGRPFAPDQIEAPDPWWREVAK